MKQKSGTQVSVERERCVEGRTQEMHNQNVRIKAQKITQNTSEEQKRRTQSNEMEKKVRNHSV